ncbi:MAG: Biotin synthase-related protein radical SAM superfamily [Candidatus Methanohalarchaeum thermophilum]|uniref:Biotin synthase-related protein radical SAM superfamily n=1 Tax=Methanohalarchaeum thermophilum TaxID=1903181 RepID=A0A1Q6DSL2_METT1|nr:MAG: Biotin synthase-related protein radical SAM superfamily [Candidatus Methanohalarchaeum thermophilum]
MDLANSKVGFPELKANILTRGLSLENSENKGGAGPTGRYVILPNGVFSTAPTYWNDENDPFTLKVEEDKRYIVFRDKELRISFPEEPSFYGKKTSDGVEMKKVALLHAKNCLATTTYQDCVFFAEGKECKFCGIRESLRNNKTIKEKKPSQLVEVAEESDRATHATLTTGIMPNKNEHEKLSRISKALKKKTDLDVHVQLSNPGRSELEELYSSGVDTVGVHLETWDKKTLREVCPGKAEIGREEMLDSMKNAVGVFGENQVSSYLIAGIGEDKQKFLEGVDVISETGTVPFIVPFHPIPHTPLSNNPLPKPGYMIDIYREAAEILRDNNIEPSKSKAGCVRCGACSAIKEFKNFK